jgi:hypothetical protein
MIIYAGILFVVLSSIYSFSYAAYSWKNNNKRAAMGTLLMLFLAMGLTLFVFIRT